MKILVTQTCAEMGNKFSVLYNDKLIYRAELPFLNIEEPLGLEKKRKIKIFDLSGNEVCHSEYKYLENKVEELIPFKYLFTKSQKFYQIIFSMNNQTVHIFKESRWHKTQYIINLNDKKYICYSIQKGVIRHFPIYDGDVQVGEILKSNIIIDGKDEYWGYLKDEYSFLKDVVAFFMLYVERTQYNSSYMMNRSYEITYSYSYNSNNKYLDENWVKNNFDDSFYKKLEKDKKTVKYSRKHIISTMIAECKSLKKMTKKQKIINIIMFIILIFPWLLALLILLLD